MILLFLCASDRHIESLQVFKQNTLICCLFCARDYYDVAVDTLRLVNSQHLLNSVLAQMRLKKLLLVQERDDGDFGSFYTTVLKVIDNHRTYSCFDEVLVFETLAFFEFYAQDNFVSLQKVY